MYQSNLNEIGDRHANESAVQTKDSMSSVLVFNCLMVVITAAVSLVPSIAVAQRAAKQINVVEFEDVERDDDPDGEEMWAQGAFPRMNRQMLRESLFGALGGSENAFQKMKRESIRRELDRIEQICGLSEEQKLKVENAIEIDIQQIHAKIETLLSEFDSKMTIEQFQQIQQNVYGYANQVNSPGGDSNEIWRKVLRSMLTTEQTDKLAQDKVLVEANRHRSRRLQILLQFQRKLGLVETQRASVLQWLNTQESLDDPFWKWCERLLAAVEVGGLQPGQLEVLKNVPKNEIGDLGNMQRLNRIKMKALPDERLGR